MADNANGNIDRHSLTWKALEKWASERKALATADLIQGSTRPGGDDKLRGEISAMDDLLELGKPPAE